MGKTRSQIEREVDEFATGAQYEFTKLVFECVLGVSLAYPHIPRLFLFSPATGAPTKLLAPLPYLTSFLFRPSELPFTRQLMLTEPT